ncbi:MAG: HD domain-containing protein [Christensenellales bacterium]|jgi:metal-dependent HD superfamily phosphatase/phosphodiesterase
MSITLKQVKNNAEIKAYIQHADKSLAALGFTEHSLAHVTKCAVIARRILLETGHGEREAELAAIAAYLHDIGNMVNRNGHERSGALMAFTLLRDMGASPDDIATIITAIGHHDESTAFPVNDVAAALILADKTDVRSTRVRSKDTILFDIHDRVNYAVKESEVVLTMEDKIISLVLSIDTTVSTISEYFEIFLSRMMLCRRAAERLGLRFALVINGQSMM